MTEVSNAVSETLTREQLLSALDSEISSREEQASHLGYSDWALKGAFVAILWTGVNEIAEGNHTWRGTLLILFAGWVMLMFLEMIAGDNRSQPTYEGAKGTERVSTFRDVLVRRRIHPAIMPYLIAEVLGLFAIAVTLGYHGFATLGRIAGTILICVLVILLVVLCLTYLRLPMRINPEIERQKPRYLTYVPGCFFVASLILVIISVNDVFHTWGSITKGDLRLGLLLAALLTVLGLHVRLARPAPDLATLKSIRSRLAFGWVGLETAKNEVENILLGFSKDYYLASKALQLIEVLKQITRLNEEALAAMQETMNLATTIKKSESNQALAQKILEKITRLDAQSYYKLKATIGLWDRSLHFRKQLDLRLKIAEVLLDIKEEEIRDLLGRVAEAVAASDLSREPIRNLHERYMEKKEEWSSLGSGKLDARRSRLRYRELLNALFSE